MKARPSIYMAVATIANDQNINRPTKPIHFTHPKLYKESIENNENEDLQSIGKINQNNENR